MNGVYIHWLIENFTQKNMKQSNFFHIVLISGSTMISGVINYFYYPVMLKYLTLTEFGEFASLVGVINILLIFLVGVSFFLTREYSKNIKDMRKVKAITYWTLPLLSLFGVLVYALYAAISPIIQIFLKIDEIWPVLLSGLVFPISAVSVIFTSLLRSLRKFTFISLTQLMNPVIKILVWFLLVYSGYKVMWGLGGLVVSSLIINIAGCIYVYRLLHGVEYHSERKWLFQVLSGADRSMLRFMFESALFTFFMNADVLIIKNLLSPEVAGIYAGISVVGKFVIFLTMSLETVYYGQIMEHTLESIPRKLIFEPLTIIISIIIFSVIGMFIFWEYILYFMRPDLVGKWYLLVLVVVYSWLLSYVSLVAKVLIWWWILWINRILSLWAICLIVSVYLIPFSNLISYISILILPISIIAVILSSMLWYHLMWKNKA